MTNELDAYPLRLQVLILLSVADKECPHSFGCNQCRADVIASAIETGFLP